MELTPDVIAQYGIVTDNPFSCGNCGGFYPFKEVRLTLNTAPFYEATCLDCLPWHNLPLCGACGQFHAVGDDFTMTCDLEIEEALDNLLSPCVVCSDNNDFVCGSRECRCYFFSVMQGVQEVAEELIRKGVKRVRIDHTGGMNMVVIVPNEEQNRVLSVTRHAFGIEVENEWQEDSALYWDDESGTAVQMVEAVLWHLPLLK